MVVSGQLFGHRVNESGCIVGWLAGNHMAVHHTNHADLTCACALRQARIYREGLSQMASGEAVFKWSTQRKTWPVSAGAFNHRAEALYRCAAENPLHDLVQDALRKGLRNVKMM